jgi:hypothetical protein
MISKLCLFGVTTTLFVIAFLCSIVLSILLLIDYANTSGDCSEENPCYKESNLVGWIISLCLTLLFGCGSGICWGLIDKK